MSTHQPRNTEEMPEKSKRNVILGIGNKVLSDDAAGLRVVRHLLKNHPNLKGVEIVDGGSLSYGLTTLLENTDNFIVIDAAKLDRKPGTVSTFMGSEMDLVLKRPQRNTNEMALAEIVNLVWLAQQLPTNRALITIEPKKTTWGTRLSTNITRVVPQVAEYALTLMSQWTGLSFDLPQMPPQNQPLQPLRSNGNKNSKH